MIKLTKFDGDPFTVNVLHILKIEAHHETRLIYTNGQSQLVKESEEEVVNRINEFYKNMISGLSPFTKGSEE